MTVRWLAPALLALAALVGCSGAAKDHAAPPSARPSLAVWSEFLSDDDVRAELPLLAASGIELNLAVSSDRIGDSALEALIFDAVAAGVEVRAWLLLSQADGYWPNETNLPALTDAALAFADWRDAHALPIDWVIFDLEMSLERTRAVADASSAGGTLAGVEAIRAGRDPAAFSEHRADLSALVDTLHGRQLRVQCATYPMVLDDPADGDDDIQDELDVPVLGIAWDEATFMVYQSTFFDLTGSWHGPDVVGSYAGSAKSSFGARASIALGIVGSAGITPVAMPYPDAATLLTDHAAARAAGIDRVSIYSLDGLAQQPDPAAWLAPDVTPEVPAPQDAAALRTLSSALLD